MSIAVTAIDLLTGLDREADRQDALRASLQPGASIWVRLRPGSNSRPAVFRGWCERTGKARVLLVPQHGGAPRPALADPAGVSR